MAPPTIYRPTRTHPSSLIPASEHHPDLLWLMSQRVNAEMVDYIAAKVREVVPHCCEACHPPTSHKRSDSLSTLPSPPVTPTKPAFQNGSGRRGEHEAAPLPVLEDFLGNIISSSKIQAPTLLCTLIYLERIRPRLPPIESAPHSRSPDVQHRVLMATIVCAAKYLNDSSPKNKHWALYSYGLLTCQDVNAMELQLLGLLDWDLRLTEGDCTSAFSVFFGKSESRTTRQPTTPPKDAAARVGPSQPVQPANSSSHLSVPSNRRASRPARIEVTTGPAHLHSSFARSDAPNALLSPPPSAVSANFNGRQGIPPADDNAELSSGVDTAKKVGYMHTFSAGHARATQEPTVQTRSSTSHPNVRFAADPIIPTNEAVIGNTEDSISSWPSLSRANGLLERVWGGSHHIGRNSIRSSRSVGGLFRAATSDALAERAAARV